MDWFLYDNGLLLERVNLVDTEGAIEINFASFDYAKTL